jgi:hypothetical protein
MTKKLIILVVALSALVFAATAATYTVRVFDPLTVNGKDLKPGDYKLSLENNKATIFVGKERIESTVKVEATSEKFSSTSVRFAQDNGKNKVQEIRLGGTKTKLVFN